MSSAPVGWRPSLGWAAVAGALLLTILWYAPGIGERGYQTATGEQRLVTLADGSTVMLNTATRIGVEYTASERRIRLERGEALFQVTPDSQRPFIVSAGTGWARALGTRFNVALDGESVIVVVLQGLVEVRSRTGAAEKSAELSTGESVAFGPGGTLTHPAPERASPDRIEAWRAGKLRFDDWSLEHAIAEHNRYARTPIRMDRGVPTDVRVSGTFRIGDTEAFLGALRELMTVQIVNTGQSVWLVPQTSLPAGIAEISDPLPNRQ
jgi:transmembrane sensor